jgi:hypothetical protein
MTAQVKGNQQRKTEVFEGKLTPVPHTYQKFNMYHPRSNTGIHSEEEAHNHLRHEEAAHHE